MSEDADMSQGAAFVDARERVSGRASERASEQVRRR